MRYGRCLPSLVFAALTLLVSGCSEGPFDADVSGKITLDGRPMPPGVVVFSAVEGKRNSSRGRIEEGGDYFLVTRHHRGIDPGDYRVSLQVFEKGDPPGPGERAPVLPPLVPKRFLDPASSGLRYTVEPGSNRIDIEVESGGGDK